ncbi:hypothetical protein Tco_1201453 [Tanacetum coccineum]
MIGYEMNEKVADAFMSHYEIFLRQLGTVTPLNVSNMFQKRLNEMDALEMIRAVSDKEIKDAVFSMGNDKSSGPDSFTAAFFKEAWDIVATDVISDIREFFVNGKLLKEINHTIIALIPKVASPACVNDFRPISCCNVLFKCRSISDNILLTQELMHIYHLDRGFPRCAFKIDIQKAHDMVNWSFLREVLIGFGFHNRLVGWIMECLSILQILPFKEGRLPVKYLDVPLVSYQLIYRDCKELIEKVQKRVNDWKNKSLSTAGRLQLIQSVIGLLHVFWASVFILPSRILLEIEQIMRGFLWCHGSLSRDKLKVAWEVVCLPNVEGGLGGVYIVLLPMLFRIGTYPGRVLIRNGVTVMVRLRSSRLRRFGVPSDRGVWYEMKGFAGLPNSSSSIDAILNDIYPFAMKKTSRKYLDSVDKNYSKDVQLQDEDIMYDIASSVEYEELKKEVHETIGIKLNDDDAIAVPHEDAQATLGDTNDPFTSISMSKDFADKDIAANDAY